MNVCFVSPFPPRHDGISEFNQDLISELKKNNPSFEYTGVAINQNNQLPNDNDKRIIFQIRKQVTEDYLQAARIINSSNTDIVCLQLEYALFGGYDGAYVKTLIKNLTKKLVIIVHGLPINSYSRRKKTRQKFFQEIAPFTSLFITINPLEEKVLRSWGIKNKIVNILHGAPDEILDYQYLASRKSINLSDKLVIFNFGLIHEKKGLEYLLQGFLNFTKEYQNAKLIIAGEPLSTATKQNYLDSLKKYVSDNKMENNVTFINTFLNHEALFTYLSASDIVALPYIKRDLVSSGPLSFAAMADKFIITTPFPYAKVLLNQEEAYFIPYKNSVKITEALKFYVENKNKVNKTKANLVKKNKSIAWSNVARKYYQIFKSL
ncbi:MAG TPA: glycosyltransferase [Patescibacteria group bacterium]|nr:glycosyltransferase [Patescibacteria group bacterium]